MDFGDIPTELKPGAELARGYRITRKIAEGGMGRVYEAEQLSLKRIVALKQTFFTSPTNLAWIKQEGELLCRLKHENLPKVHDFFEEAGDYFLAMEFITGDSLQTISNNLGPCPPRAVFLIAEQLLKTLEYMHGQSPALIHRDIKPDNIKLNDRVFLLDFGLSKEMSSSTLVKGATRGYSSPEQESGSETDERSDIYSLGATLFKLITAKQPPSALSRIVASSRRANPLRLPREIDPSAWGGLTSVMNKAMAIEPEDRYQTVAGMLRDLRRAATGVNWDVSADTGWHEVVKALSPQQDLKPPQLNTNTARRFLYALCAVGLIVVFCSIGYMLWPTYLAEQRLKAFKDGRLGVSILSDVGNVEIHPSLPLYHFRLVGEGNTANTIQLRIEFETPDVIPFSDRKSDKLEHPEMRVNPVGYESVEAIESIDWGSALRFSDLNFDGYADLQFVGNAGVGSHYMLCWIFKQATGHFEFSNPLTEIFSRYSDVRLDLNNKTIFVVRHRSAEADHKQTYAWVNGVPVTVFDSDPDSKDRPQ